MSTPVTVEVRRQTDPARAGEAAAWIDDGLRLAREFDGCLGGGVIRDSDDANVLHVLYRFSDEKALTDWEHSEQRRRWLREGSLLVLDAKVQRRTGIEGWFDGPQLRRTIDAVTGDEEMVVVRSAPLRWKQLCAIWLGMFPLNMLVGWLVSMLPWWSELSIPLRSALTVTMLAPTMVFIMMPMVTRTLRHWLRTSPGLIKKERSLNTALDELAAKERYVISSH